MRNFIASDALALDARAQSHEHIATYLSTLFAQWSARGHGGMAFAFGYVAGTTPHVRFYRRENRPCLDSLEAFGRWRPDLVIEVAPDDGDEALATHAGDRIPEVWILDPDARTLERYLFDDGAYAKRDALEGAMTFRPRAFDPLTIELARVWELAA